MPERQTSSDTMGSDAEEPDTEGSDARRSDAVGSGEVTGNGSGAHSLFDDPAPPAPDDLGERLRATGIVRRALAGFPRG